MYRVLFLTSEPSAEFLPEERTKLMRVCSLAPLSEAILDRLVVQLGLGIPIVTVHKRVHALGQRSQAHPHEELAAVDALIADTQAKSVLDTSSVLQVLDILLTSKMPLVLFKLPGASPHLSIRLVSSHLTLYSLILYSYPDTSSNAFQVI